MTGTRVIVKAAGSRDDVGIVLGERVFCTGWEISEFWHFRWVHIGRNDQHEYARKEDKGFDGPKHF